MKKFKLLFILLAIVCLNSHIQNVTAATAAGTIESLKGKAWATDTQQKRRDIEKGDAVASGEVIHTSKRSAVSIRFQDETFFALGENSEMQITKFKYARGDQSNSMLTKVLRGSFRFISGLVAKTNQESMRVNAGSVATIGIRGTHVGGEVIPRETKDGKVVKEESTQVVLLKPEKGDKPTAIEVSNKFGSTVVDKPGYGTEVPDEHSAPSPARKMQIRTINRINRALRNATKVSRGVR